LEATSFKVNLPTAGTMIVGMVMCSHSQPNGADSVSLLELLRLAHQSDFFHAHVSQYWPCSCPVDEVSQCQSALAALSLQLWDTVHAPPTAVDPAGPMEDSALAYTSGALDLS